MKRIKFEIEFINDESSSISLFIIKDKNGNERLCRSFELDDVISSLVSD